VVVQGVSPLIWCRRLVHSDMPLATLQAMPSATALGNRISTGFVESTVNQVIGKCFCIRQ
jgi:predicted DNA-binding transcriptional regulator AlpA